LAFSQQSFDWSKYNDSPFKQDSAQSYLNSFSELANIGSILHSTAAIELRYCFSPGRGVYDQQILYQVKLDSQRVERRVYFMGYYRKSKPENAQYVGPVGLLDCYSREVTPSKPHEDSLFAAAYSSVLIGIPDQRKLIDSLRKQNITVYDRDNNTYGIRCFHCPRGFDLVELKIGNQFRSFRLSQQNDVLYVYNPEITIFKTYTELNRRLKHYFEDYCNAYLYGWNTEPNTERIK
jgi:hypothetical protein